MNTDSNISTLVIHPEDPTTDFLSEIYRDREWTVIRDPNTGNSALRNAIRNHHRVIFMGHGTEYGLFSIRGTQQGFWIDPHMVGTLRSIREAVYIWCNADQFVERYRLGGLYTGMIVSEMEEARLYNFLTEEAQIITSNATFARAMREAVFQPDAVEIAQRLYVAEHEFEQFNHGNIYFR